MTHPDCIIVLANEMDKNGKLNIESLSRIQTACDLLKKNPHAYLITCGWNYRKDSPLMIAEVMKGYAIQYGIAPDKIITEINSRDTVGDAIFSKYYVVQMRNWKKIQVVTSQYHVERSEQIFNFIYGKDYTIEMVGCHGFENEAQKNIAEKKSIAAFLSTFKNIMPGDDVNIKKRFISQHPFYNGEIYSPIQFIEKNET